MKAFTSVHICALIITLLLIVCVSRTSQKLSRDAACHMIEIQGCNVSLYKIFDYEEAGWFYHAPFRSCRRFFADKGLICSKNQDLPRTRDECERLCGTHCDLPDGSFGVCRMEGSCDIKLPASWNPRPCHAYNVQCCPRSSNENNIFFHEAD